MTLRRMHHREALDHIRAVPENRKFINGIIRYVNDENKTRMAGTSMLFGYNIFVLEIIMKRRPAIVSIVVSQRLDVVEKKGYSDIPPHPMPKYYPKRYKIEGY